MRSLSLPCDPAAPLNILCLGAHSDDIGIGCGGGGLFFAPNVFHWVGLSADGVRAAEARQASALFAGTRSVRGPLLKTFRDGFFPFEGAEVKATFEELKAISPDLIFTHSRQDSHQDHRLVAELTWN